MSPCIVGDDGKVSLCAAAALAAASMELRDGENGRHIFEQRLASTGDRQLVRNVFAESDLPPQLCEAVFAKNDSAPDEKRREVVLSTLLDIAARSTCH